MLPIVELIRFFAILVLEDQKLEEIMLLTKARILMNLGLSKQGEQLKTDWDSNHYQLTEEEKKINLEKIKGFKDPNENLKDK